MLHLMAVVAIGLILIFHINNPSYIKLSLRQINSSYWFRTVPSTVSASNSSMSIPDYVSDCVRAELFNLIVITPLPPIVSASNYSIVMVPDGASIIQLEPVSLKLAAQLLLALNSSMRAVPIACGWEQEQATSLQILNSWPWNTNFRSAN